MVNKRAGEVEDAHACTQFATMCPPSPSVGMPEVESPPPSLGFSICKSVEERIGGDGMLH